MWAAKPVPTTTNRFPDSLCLTMVVNFIFLIISVAKNTGQLLLDKGCNAGSFIFIINKKLVKRRLFILSLHSKSAESTCKG